MILPTQGVESTEVKQNLMDQLFKYALKKNEQKFLECCDHIDGLTPEMVHSIMNAKNEEGLSFVHLVFKMPIEVIEIFIKKISAKCSVDQIIEMLGIKNQANKTALECLYRDEEYYPESRIYNVRKVLSLIPAISANNVKALFNYFPEELRPKVYFDLLGNHNDSLYKINVENRKRMIQLYPSDDDHLLALLSYQSHTISSLGLAVGVSSNFEILELPLRRIAANKERVAKLVDIMLQPQSDGKPFVFSMDFNGEHKVPDFRPFLGVLKDLDKEQIIRLFKARFNGSTILHTFGLRYSEDCHNVVGNFSETFRARTKLLEEANLTQEELFDILSQKNAKGLNVIQNILQTEDNEFDIEAVEPLFQLLHRLNEDQRNQLFEGGPVGISKIDTVKLAMVMAISVSRSTSLISTERPLVTLAKRSATSVNIQRGLRMYLLLKSSDLSLDSLAPMGYSRDLDCYMLTLPSRRRMADVESQVDSCDEQNTTLGRYLKRYSNMFLKAIFSDIHGNLFNADHFIGDLSAVDVTEKLANYLFNQSWFPDAAISIVDVFASIEGYIDGLLKILKHQRAEEIVELMLTKVKDRGNTEIYINNPNETLFERLCYRLTMMYSPEGLKARRVLFDFLIERLDEAHWERLISSKSHMIFVINNADASYEWGRKSAFKETILPILFDAKLSDQTIDLFGKFKDKILNCILKVENDAERSCLLWLCLQQMNTNLGRLFSRKTGLFTPGIHRAELEAIMNAFESIPANKKLAAAYRKVIDILKMREKSPEDKRAKSEAMLQAKCEMAFNFTDAQIKVLTLLRFENGPSMEEFLEATRNCDTLKIPKEPETSASAPVAASPAATVSTAATAPTASAAAQVTAASATPANPEVRATSSVSIFFGKVATLFHKAPQAPVLDAGAAEPSGSRSNRPGCGLIGDDDL